MMGQMPWYPSTACA